MPENEHDFVAQLRLGLSETARKLDDGPTQAVRHLDTDMTAHMLSFVNRRHMSLDKVETAQRELIELYLRLDLPKHRGDGKFARNGHVARLVSAMLPPASV